MFRSAELGHTMSKQEYAAAEEELRPRMVQAQLAAAELGIPTCIVINGVDGAGKSEVVQHLMEWMDPRHIAVHALEKPTDVERELPFYYRFWRRVPPKGRTSIFLGSWYTPTILQRVYKELKSGAFRRELDEVVRFERLLAAEGVLILKFWMHLGKKAQKKRLKSLAADKETRWRVTDRDWAHFKMYDDFYSTSEEALRRTSAAHAPWRVIEGADKRYRAVEVSRRVLRALEERIAERRRQVEAGAQVVPTAPVEVDQPNRLDSLDLSQSLEKDPYKAEMKELRNELNMLARKCYDSRRSAVFVFEGCDAAGKGGAIRRVVQGMHPKTYRIVPVAAPTETELRFPYLWRFWMGLPRDGKVTIFDRSWYGRVMVERVEGFCTQADWQRAYAEIRDFEAQIRQSDTHVVKFWLQISEEEQLARFEARQVTPHKQHKITDEDWRNREKWPAYKAAVCEMLDRTDASTAPWVLVEAENKYFARVKVLRTVRDTLEEMLEA